MGIIDEAKSLAKTIQQMDNIELYKKILDIQAEAMDLIEENKNLKQVNEKLRDELKIKEKLEFENNLYWLKENDNERIGPFCTRCWDKEHILMRLHKKDDGWGRIYVVCPECKTQVDIKYYDVQVSY